VAQDQGGHACLKRCSAPSSLFWFKRQLLLINAEQIMPREHETDIKKAAEKHLLDKQQQLVLVYRTSSGPFTNEHGAAGSVAAAAACSLLGATGRSHAPGLAAGNQPEHDGLQPLPSSPHWAGAAQTSWCTPPPAAPQTGCRSRWRHCWHQSESAEG